jgi:hypothetical protein
MPGHIQGPKSVVKVTYDENTVILGPDGPGLTLSNGVAVVVRGTFDDASHTLKASEISVVVLGGGGGGGGIGGGPGVAPGDDTSGAGDHIGGIVTEIDVTHGVVIIKPRESNHATGVNLVKVIVSDTDKVLLGKGERPEAGNITGITVGDAVSVHGTLAMDGTFDADVIIARLAPDCVFPPPASN